MKHPRRLLALVAGASVSCILVLVGWRVVPTAASPRPPATAAASSRPSDAQNGAPRPAEAASRERRPSLAAVPEAQPGSIAPPGTDGVGAESSKTEPDEHRVDAKERARVTMAEAIHHVEIDFSEQPPDRSWTREMADKVEETLVTAQAGAVVQSVDCRRSTCRVDLLYPNEEQYRQAMNSASLLSDSEKVITRGDERPDQQWPMIIYLARRGTELPKID